MELPSIKSIGNGQLLINRRKKARRNAIIMAVFCLIIAIMVVWCLDINVNDKLDVIRPTKYKIINAVDDCSGSNEWKLIGWGEPVSTGHLQIEYETQKHYESADGTIKFYGDLEDTWNDCRPGGTMYPLEIEAYTPAFGWNLEQLCVIVRDGKVIGVLHSRRIRMRVDENGKRRHITYK